MMLHKLRKAMVRPGRDILSGIVEVDETLVGGAKTGKRGRGAEGKELVIIAAEVDGTKTGRIRIARILIVNMKVKVLTANSQENFTLDILP